MAFAGPFAGPFAGAPNKERVLGGRGAELSDDEQYEQGLDLHYEGGQGYGDEGVLEDEGEDSDDEEREQDEGRAGPTGSPHSIFGLQPPKPNMPQPNLPVDGSAVGRGLLSPSTAFKAKAVLSPPSEGRRPLMGIGSPSPAVRSDDLMASVMEMHAKGLPPSIIEAVIAAVSPC